MEKVKVRLESIVNPGFAEALRELSKKELPVRISYQIATLMDVVRTEMRKFSEVREQLLLVYGERQEDGKLAVDAETSTYLLRDQAGFDAAYKQLISLEVEVEPISKDALEGVTVKPLHMVNLLPFVK